MERRWIILGEDGRHVTLGRHSDPSPDEIAQAEAGLAAQGLRGWLAVMEGPYYRDPAPTLMMVRTLCSFARPFTEAVDAFHVTCSFDGWRSWRDRAHGGYY